MKLIDNDLMKLGEQSFYIEFLFHNTDPYFISTVHMKYVRY